MKENSIHPLSFVHPNAKIGENVVIEPFVTIHDKVEIGDNTWIGSNVVIFPNAKIGKSCKIFPGAVISADPQDLKYKNEETWTEIGDFVTIREYVTVNKGTDYRWKTIVEDHVLLMAYAHIAHDCVIGNHSIIANAVNMGGHVEVGAYAIIGGMCAVHQFSKIGAHAMISGGSLVRKDVPPYTKAGREPLSYEGVNSVGLKRRGFTTEQISQIQDIYRVIYQSGMLVSKSMEYLKDNFEHTPELNQVLSFVKNSERGIMKGYLGKYVDDSE